MIFIQWRNEICIRVLGEKPMSTEAQKEYDDDLLAQLEAVW